MDKIDYITKRPDDSSPLTEVHSYWLPRLALSVAGNFDTTKVSAKCGKYGIKFCELSKKSGIGKMCDVAVTVAMVASTFTFPKVTGLIKNSYDLSKLTVTLITTSIDGTITKREFLVLSAKIALTSLEIYSYTVPQLYIACQVFNILDGSISTLVALIDIKNTRTLYEFLNHAIPTTFDVLSTHASIQEDYGSVANLVNSISTKVF